MPMTTLTTKGQVTLPKEIRDKLHLKAHDKIVVTTDGERAILRPIHGDILNLKGIFHRKGMKPINFKKLREKAEEGMAWDAVRRGRLRVPPRR